MNTLEQLVNKRNRKGILRRFFKLVSVKNYKTKFHELIYDGDTIVLRENYDNRNIIAKHMTNGVIYVEGHTSIAYEIKAVLLKRKDLWKGIYVDNSKNDAIFFLPIYEYRPSDISNEILIKFPSIIGLIESKINDIINERSQNEGEISRLN